MPGKYDDDDEDTPSIRKNQPLSGMDAFFGNTNMALLILLACCCNGVALILGIIGLATCTDEKAKSNAKVVTIVAGILTVLGLISWIAQVMMGLGGGGFPR